MCILGVEIGIKYVMENGGIKIVSMKYILDQKLNTVHKEGCTLIGEYTVVWNELYLRMIGKGKKKVCPFCCKKDYKQLVQEKNQITIQKSGFKFISVAGRNVFHRSVCKLAMATNNILGFPTYKRAAKSGRCPCKICKPENCDEILTNTQKSRKIKEKRVNEFQGLRKAEVRAVKRYREAKEEFARNALDKNENLNTLTQTRFSFWAARGYKNFHLRNCSKLKDLQNLKGFGKYEEAVKAGYTPCKICKPTNKNNVEFSIALRSKKVEDETIDVLVRGCEKYQYAYQQEEDFFYIETPKGKWKIHIRSNPIRLEHINFMYSSRNYHRQPKLFLSFIDVFNYIKRHDK